jgi:hypothetical protein
MTALAATNSRMVGNWEVNFWLARNPGEHMYGFGSGYLASLGRISTNCLPAPAYV